MKVNSRALGAAAYGALGHIDWVGAALIGFPAIVGVLSGTWLQQRMSSRFLTLAFAALLVGVAIQLLVR